MQCDGIVLKRAILGAQDGDGGGDFAGGEGIERVRWGSGAGELVGDGL